MESKRVQSEKILKILPTKPSNGPESTKQNAIKKNMEINTQWNY
jgi:hypothetical protein